MSVDVFITYDKRDHKLGRALKEALDEEGLSAFSEVHDLIPGDLWDEVIPCNLRQAKLVVPIITPRWPVQGDRSADWYGSEKITIAVQRAERNMGERSNVFAVVMPGVGKEQIPFGLTRTAPIEELDETFELAVMGIRRAYDRLSGGLLDGIADATADKGAQSVVVEAADGNTRSTTTGR